MSFVDTPATQKIFSLKKRIRAVCGGTSASKTISIIVWCIDYAQTNLSKKIDIFAESYPHLEDGAIRDFKAIMLDREYWDDKLWNSTRHVYTFPSGSVLKFISVDKLGKAKGPRRDVMFVNEANHAMTWEVFDQLKARTTEVVWLDWNPSNEFFYEQKIEHELEHDFIRLTYLDCIDALDKRIIDEIESHKGDKNWWLVYGQGLPGVIEGRIYKDWKIIDEVPHEARLERYGLDFGWYPDPVTLDAVYYWNGSYVFDEEIHQIRMPNSDLAGTLKNKKRALTVADSAEPKSIAELHSFGINVVPTKKGADSVRHGIMAMQDQRIFVTKRSVNIIKEYRNYLWQTDKDGNLMPGTPVKGNDHHMDGLRYAVGTLIPIMRKREYAMNVPSHFFQRKNVNRAR